MKKIGLGLGLVAATALFAAAPAMAQVGFDVEPGGVGVGVPGTSYNSCGYHNNCGGFYDHDRGSDVVIGAPGHGGWHGHGFHGHDR